MSRLMKGTAWGLCLSALACGSGFTAPHEIKAPSEARIDEPVTVAATGSFTADDALSWTAIGGRFDGPTNGPTAVFVPTAGGTATVLFTITAPDGRAVVSEATMAVAGSGDGPPVRGAAGDAAAQAAAAVAPRNIEDEGFVPSGFMGDGEREGAIRLVAADREMPHSPPSAYRIGYTPGPVGWAAIAWQYPANNWGDRPGRNLHRGFRQVSVWARGVPDRTGAFPKVQFKAGGSTDPARRHQASFEVIGDLVTLTGEWTQHVLTLPPDADLSNVAAAFVVVIHAKDVSASGATFLLDDIEYR